MQITILILIAIASLAVLLRVLFVMAHKESEYKFDEDRIVCRKDDGKWKPSITDLM